MRAIDADTLTQILEGERDYHEKTGFTDRANGVMDAIMDVISAPTIEEWNWILCSERLPANDDFVVITILDESGDTPHRYSDFGWYLDAAKCWIVDAERRTDVIAWMPLPKPYKERRKG